MKRFQCQRPILLCFLIFALSGNLFAQEYKTGPIEKDFSGYLFAYFKGNSVSDESVCFALPDGLSIHNYHVRVFLANKLMR